MNNSLRLPSYHLLSAIAILGLAAPSLHAQRSYQTFWEERFSEMETPQIIEDDATPLDPSMQEYLIPTWGGLLHPEAPFRRPDAISSHAETPEALLYYSEGVLALKAGQTARALREFERAIEADPNHLQARLKAAEAALGVNDLSRSTLLFEQVLEIDPENVPALLGLGRSLLMRDRVEEARGHFEEVLEIRPRNISALTSLTQIAHESDRDYEASLKFATSILHIDDQNIHGLLFGAEAAAHVGNMEESLALYRRLFRARPALVERMIHFASRLVAMNRQEDAAQLYEEAVRVFPNHGMILRIWEDHLATIGGVDRVREGYRDLQEGSPNNEQIAELYARYLKRQGDWESLAEVRREILDRDISHIPSLIDMAEYHLERDEFDQADPFFQAAISASPQDGDIYRNIGRSYLEHGKLEQAEKILRSSLAYQPNDIDSLMMMARVKEELGNADVAIRYLRKALEESPANANLLGKLGQIYLKKGDEESAKALFQQVTAANPMDLDAWIVLAELHFKSDDDTGLTMLEEEARRHLRSRPDFDFQYGAMALEHGQFDRARKSLERALDALPENLEIRSALARTCLHLDLQDLAFRVMEEGNEHTRDDRMLVLRHKVATADILSAASAHKEAGALYRELAEENEDNIILREAHVLSLVRQGLDDEAMEALNKFVQDFGADHPRDTQLLRARYFIRIGQYDRAVGRLQSLIREYPGDNDISVQLAIAAGGAGDLEKAEKIYRDLIDLGDPSRNPWYETASNNLGYLFAEEGIRLEEAEELISQALAVSPNAAYILDSMGWVYFQRGEFEKAREYLERAAHLSLGDGDILFHLAQLYEQLGKFDQARTYYDRALKADPRLDQAREKRDAMAVSRGETSSLQ
ncbi:MAG: tetratricopeptide repeat protein [Candidatus Sumerlaeia bacterium]|nr:tetratricopeptide repeat protein [Candidatus Sumerlaeia bacterium]